MRASEAKLAAWRAKYRENPLRQLWSNRKYRYGYTEEAVMAMVERQGHACPICRTDLRPIPANKWHIDHDHTTGDVRGVLCRACNLKLGLIEKAGGFNFESASEYLRYHKDCGHYSI